MADTKYPRSAYDKVGGIVYFPRMLDKIRLHADGQLPADYHKNLGQGHDARTCRYLHVDYPKVVERVKQGGTDEEILQWCYQQGRALNETEIEIWNGFMTKRGWNDEMSETLEKYKKDNGLGHRPDIVTGFDFYEVDEKRKP